MPTMPTMPTMPFKTSTLCWKPGSKPLTENVGQLWHSTLDRQTTQVEMGKCPATSPIPSQNWLYHALNSHEVFNECQHLCSWKKPLPVVVAHFILEKPLSCCPVLRMCLQAEKMFRVAIDGLEQTLGKQHANSQAARGGLSRSC